MSTSASQKTRTRRSSTGLPSAPLAGATAPRSHYSAGGQQVGNVQAGGQAQSLDLGRELGNHRRARRQQNATVEIDDGEVVARVKAVLGAELSREHDVTARLNLDCCRAHWASSDC